jgi:hypothetical protein
VISSIGIYLCKTNKVAIVKPWTTGISGQLQKALVTGKYLRLYSSISVSSLRPIYNFRASFTESR